MPVLPKFPTAPLRCLLWLALAAQALLLLQLIHYALHYLLLALQSVLYAVLDERCVTVGRLGIDRHWPSREYEWRTLQWDFCSALDFPRGVVKEQIWLLPWWPALAFVAVVVLAVIVDIVWSVGRARRAGLPAGRFVPWRRPVLIAVLLMIALGLAASLRYGKAPREFANAAKVLRLEPPFFHFGGLAYAARDPGFSELADSNEDNYRSPVLLFENRTLLGPAHSLHADIVSAGAGRFSHWSGGGVVFSTKDGKPPDTPGKVFWLVLPRR